MIKWIKGLYEGEQLSSEMKIFNIVHLICVLGMILVTFLVGFFVPNQKGIYLTFSICVLFFITMLEANRHGDIKRSIIFMSLVFNLIYMPAVFFMYAKFVCVIPVYFLVGLIYSILLLDIKTGIILASIETVYYMAILIFGYRHIITQIEGIAPSEIYIRYIGAMIGTVIVGTIAGVAVRFRYIFFQKEYEKAEKLKTEAMEAYVAKDIFLINMSHEIRTPMNAIVGTIDLLLDQGVNERVSDGVYNILNSCNALLSITDELMDLSKSESGQLDLFVSSYDLNELLMEIINMMTVRLTESNLNFYVDINKNIPKNLRGDSSKIRQLFVNLLNNAIKYTKSGKIILRVDYRVVEADIIELIVDVEDTGEGIRKEDIGKLFKRNEIVHSDDEHVSQTEGTGLGLAICSEIVSEMGGTISVESEYQVGSIFTFKLPQQFTSLEAVAFVPNADQISILVYEHDGEHAEYCRRLLDGLGVRCDIAKNAMDFERMLSVNEYNFVFIANENSEECNAFLNGRLNAEKIIAFVNIDDNLHIDKAATVLNRPVNVITIEALLKNENNNYVRDIVGKGGFVCPHATILVVDDNHTNLSVASAILQRYSANVITAISGKECLRIIRENDVDMIFLDYMMPEMNGIDTLECIRALPGSRYSSMPVVALTANVISGAREMFLEAGFDDFMSKPISIDKMEKVLKKYLHKDLIVSKEMILKDNE